MCVIRHVLATMRTGWINCHRISFYFFFHTSFYFCIHSFIHSLNGRDFCRTCMRATYIFEYLIIEQYCMQKRATAILFCFCFLGSSENIVLIVNEVRFWVDITSNTTTRQTNKQTSKQKKKKKKLAALQREFKLS